MSLRDFPQGRFGAITFDDPHTHQEAWIARAGEPPERINGPNEVPSSAVWMTNLSYSLEREAGIQNHALYRRTDYLRLRSSRIAEVMGIDAQEPARETEYVARVFERVMNCVATVYGFDTGTDEHSESTLRRAIRARLSGYDARVEERVRDAIGAATCAWASCLRDDSSQAGEWLFFRRPPTTHAQQVLRCRPPEGPWYKVKPRAMPGKKIPTEQLVEWVQNTSYHFITRITVHRTDPAYAHLINFGTGAQSFRVGRAWVTDIELLVLVQFCSVEIHEAWYCAGWMDITQARATVDGLSPLADCSVSLGLLADNIWTAVGTRYRPPRRIAGTQPTAHAAEPFIRAEDRRLCLEAALALHEAGLTIRGYGAGQVIAEAPPDMDDTELFASAVQAGLLPPALSEMEDFEGYNTKDPLVVAQILFARARTDEVDTIDGKLTTKMIEDYNDQAAVL